MILVASHNDAQQPALSASEVDAVITVLRHSK